MTFWRIFVDGTKCVQAEDEWAYELRFFLKHLPTFEIRVQVLDTTKLKTLKLKYHDDVQN